MDQEEFKEIACLIKFIIILDNEGKLIYGRYYDITEPQKQREFEKKLCLMTQSISVSKDEVDIFNINEYNVISKIIRETGLFIGIDEEENECLAVNFFSIFENVLLNILNDNLSRQNIFNNYQKIVVLIDEMVNEGIVMNTDSESLENRIGLKEEAGSQYMSFEKSSSGSGSLFGSFLSGARSIFGN